MFKINFSSDNEVTLSKLATEKLAGRLEDWERNIWQFIAQLCEPSIQAISISTSGSTGTPKQIEHWKQAVFNSAKMTCRALNLKPGNTALLCLPANKIGGMMMIVRSFCNKMDLYCIKPSSTPFGAIDETLKIDFAAFTPMQFHEILNHTNALKKAESISKIILGGQNTDRELESVIQSMPNEVYLTFAMTETISHIALKKLNGKKPAPYFTLLPDIKISVDERSCMLIDAPRLGCNHLVTNDIIRIVSDNEFEWLGRWDNVINSGGIKIFPEEIEQKLRSQIKRDFFIGALPDKKLGQKLVLVIEAQKFKEEETIPVINAFSQLDKIQRPKEILLVPELERTDNGKIKRTESINRVYKAILL